MQTLFFPTFLTGLFASRNHAFFYVKYVRPFFPSVVLLLGFLLKWRRSVGKTGKLWRRRGLVASNSPIPATLTLSRYSTILQHATNAVLFRTLAQLLRYTMACSTSRSQATLVGWATAERFLGDGLRSWPSWRYERHIFSTVGGYCQPAQASLFFFHLLISEVPNVPYAQRSCVARSRFWIAKLPWLFSLLCT